METNRVRINRPGSLFHGEHGVIVETLVSVAKVQLDSGYLGYFALEFLEGIEEPDASPVQCTS